MVSSGPFSMLCSNFALFTPCFSENMEYNKAKISIDGKIYDFLHSNNLGDTLSKEISEYAQLGYDCHNYSEIIAECFSSKNLKDISESILKELRR